MKRAKMSTMVAEATTPKVGRPRKFVGRTRRLQVILPQDWSAATEEVQEEEGLPNFQDAFRALYREALDARGKLKRK